MIAGIDSLSSQVRTGPYRGREADPCAVSVHADGGIADFSLYSVAGSCYAPPDELLMEICISKPLPVLRRPFC